MVLMCIRTIHADTVMSAETYLLKSAQNLRFLIVMIQASYLMGNVKNGHLSIGPKCVFLPFCPHWTDNTNSFQQSFPTEPTSSYKISTRLVEVC